MSLMTYAFLVGQKSGQIKGSITQKGREGSIGVIAVAHSIVSPRDPLDTSSTTGYRFGVEDENGKINLNAVRQMIKKDTTGKVKDLIMGMIQKIPNINEDQATAVINWTQEGGTPDSGELGYSR